MKSTWLLRMRPLFTALYSLGRSLGNSSCIMQREGASVFYGLGLLVERVTTHASDGKTVVCKTTVYFLSCARSLCE